MNDNEEALRGAIRELIKKELDEMTTTGNVAGYLTPKAFRGDKQSNVSRMKGIAQQTGYKLTSVGKQQANAPADKMEMIRKKLEENKYYEYKKDNSKSAHKKIAEAISQLNKNLYEIERVIKMNARLKTESGIASEQLWKRTQNSLLKMEAKLLGLATRIREIRGQ